jgi:hypothetical protein
MKSKFITFLAALLVLPVLGIGRAQAQADATVRADIPFAFYAGNQQMAAGSYEVGVDVANHLILIRDRDGRNESFLMGIMSDSSRYENPVMVFDHLGDSYFLRDVKTPDTEVNFPTPKAERMLARSNSSQEVVVAMNYQ